MFVAGSQTCIDIVTVDLLSERSRPGCIESQVKGQKNLDNNAFVENYLYE